MNEDPTALTAKLIICDFSTNKNDVKLNRNTAENWIHTLVSQPVVGKIAITDNGEADFTGHNLHPVIKLGRWTKILNLICLGFLLTENIGKECTTKTGKGSIFGNTKILLNS